MILKMIQLDTRCFRPTPSVVRNPTPPKNSLRLPPQLRLRNPGLHQSAGFESLCLLGVVVTKLYRNCY